jgi:hypothetical protein
MYVASLWVYRRMSEGEQIQKGKVLKRYVAILLVGIIFTAILLYQTPHTYVVTEPVYGYVMRTRTVPYTSYESQLRRDLEKTLNTNGVLKGGYKWDWDLYDLSSDTLYIIVDISSTDDVEVIIKDRTGKICDYTSKRHNYHVYGVGPVLDVEVYNPWGIFYNPDAVVSGNIKIYHEYYKTVPVTKYRTETYESWEIVDYKTSTQTVVKPWWMR